MDQTFLDHFLSIAIDVTQAERGLAVDHNLNILQLRNLSDEEINKTEFHQFALANLREAIETRDAILANNIITDLNEAPTTNTNFANLRIAVALPVAEAGAVYLDRHIRNGVIPKEIVSNLMALVEHSQQNQLSNTSLEELKRLYRQISLSSGV